MFPATLEARTATDDALARREAATGEPGPHLVAAGFCDAVALVIV
jgi:hypothetical protein